MKNKLQKYMDIDLDKIFMDFYNSMLSNPDFSGYFRDDDQIQSLMVRQKQFLLETILLSDEEIKSRYIILGEMHYDLNLPYVDFMAAISMLEQGMIQALVSNDESIEMIDITFHFFKLIRAYTAKGYLNKMLEADIADIDLYLSHVQKASEIDTMLATERVIWLKNVIFAIKIENRAAAPSLHMPQEITDSIKAAAMSDPALVSYALEISSRMELNARNVFFFLDKGSYEEVLPLYRELMSIYKLTLMLTNVVTIATSNTLAAELSKDPLTGLLTRLSFSKIINREISIAIAGRYQLSFIMMDIDFFKHINDTYGHSAGDDVLSKIASLAAESIRATDFSFRLGGEEFLFVLKGASLTVTLSQAEIIRQKIEGFEFIFDNKPVQITASFGVSIFESPFQQSYTEMIDSVDKKLYKAKASGRNIVVS